jgi:hypothetical protein
MTSNKFEHFKKVGTLQKGWTISKRLEHFKKAGTLQA